MTVCVQSRKAGMEASWTNKDGNLFQQGSMVIGNVNCTGRETLGESETDSEPGSKVLLHELYVDRFVSHLLWGTWRGRALFVSFRETYSISLWTKSYCFSPIQILAVCVHTRLLQRLNRRILFSKHNYLIVGVTINLCLGDIWIIDGRRSHSLRGKMSFSGD